MSRQGRGSTRREFLKALGATAAAPYFLTSSALGAGGQPAANDRIVMGCVGMGGQGSGDMRGFLGFPQVQVVAVCDCNKGHRDGAKNTVDQKYKNTDCVAVNDFREITQRDGIDAILIGTPDHWHAIVSCDAMRHAKDVYCEKPETLTIREGRTMVETARRYGRVFSGGSQRVWGDYNWFHRMVRGGVIGELKEAWVDCDWPSTPCNLPGEPIPPGLDWDMWLGPAPWAAFNKGRLNFRPWRDYSGGGMTDWGAHNFGGALFTCNLQDTGPAEILPPDGQDNKLLTFVFENGLRMHHKGGWGGNLSFRGTLGELPDRTGKLPKQPPNIQIANYHGSGGIFGDFLTCVRTRQRPFRDIEVAHRTVTVCHLGNIAYALGRPLKWDHVKEEFIGDDDANRWLDRPKREPWRL